MKGVKVWLPMWVEAVLLSETYNTPPWEMFPEYGDNKWVWIKRIRLINRVRNEITDEAQRKAKLDNQRANPKGLKAI